MEIRFGISGDDYDETIDRLSDLSLCYEVLQSVPARNHFVIRVFVSTYKEMALANYVVMLFAMLRDE